MKIIYSIIACICVLASCTSSSHMQCDEVYSYDYNCPERDYYNFNTYRAYYPNTETVYFVPYHAPKTCEPKCNDHATPSREIITGPRPTLPSHRNNKHPKTNEQ